MGITRVQHIFNPKSGLAEDAVINTFYFQTAVDPTDTSDPSAQQIIDLRLAVYNFYETPPVASYPIINFLHLDGFAQPRHSFKFYNMDDPMPRAPFHTNTPAGQPSNPTTTGFPSEVAFCLSFRGPLESGGQPGRRRGRLYLGPIRNSVGTKEVSSGQQRPDQDMMNVSVNAAKALQEAAMATGAHWVVYSPTSRGAGTAAQASTVITHAWADNAFDTQRRRGLAPSARTVNEFLLIG